MQPKCVQVAVKARMELSASRTMMTGSPSISTNFDGSCGVRSEAESFAVLLPPNDPWNVRNFAVA